jgi:hypothetical protein
MCATVPSPPRKEAPISGAIPRAHVLRSHVRTDPGATSQICFAATPPPPPLPNRGSTSRRWCSSVPRECTTLKVPLGDRGDDETFTQDLARDSVLDRLSRVGYASAGDMMPLHLRKSALVMRDSEKASRGWIGNVLNMNMYDIWPDSSTIQDGPHSD